MMCPEFRFARVWKMEVSYKNSALRTVYQSSPDSLLCHLNNKGDCKEYTETYFTLQEQNVYKIDTVKLSNVDEGTKGTYCFTLVPLSSRDQSFFQQKQIMFK